MSLPRVSYGNYNYGQYANPTPVKYKGGLGEGLTGLAAGIIAGKKKKKKEEKQKLEAADTTSAIAEQKYQAALNENIGKARLQNQKWIIEQKEGYGNVVRDYKLGKIDRDTYLEKMNYYNTLLTNLGTFKEQITTISKMNNGQDIDLSLLRNNPEAYRAEIHRRALRDGNVFIGTGKNGEVMLDVATWSENIGKEDSRIDISLQGAIGDPRFYTPELSYNQSLNKLYNAEITALAANSSGKGLHTSISEDGRDIVKFDETKRDEIKSYVLKNGKLDGILVGDEKRKYFEDNMGNGLGSWQNTDEQNALVRNALAEDMVNSLSGKVISNTKSLVPKNTGVSDTQKANQALIDQMRRINENAIKTTKTQFGPITQPDIDYVLKNYNALLGRLGQIQKDSEDGKYYLVSRQESFAGQAFKQEVNISNLSELMATTAIFLGGRGMIELLGEDAPGGLPTNK
tara:strand:- start:2468 stop:3838 length:1371 start_codon:yes stop_codon:yes gene_type:complete